MQTQANSPSLYSCPFLRTFLGSLHWTRPWLSLYKCFTIFSISGTVLSAGSRRQQRGAFSKPSFQQSHRTKARVQCSGPSGKGIERKEEQMAQLGLGEEDSASAEPPHAHFSRLPSPHGGSSQTQLCHTKGRTPQPLGLQQAHRPLCQDTLPLPPFSQSTCGQMKLTEAHFVKSLTVQTLWCPVRYKARLAFREGLADLISNCLCSLFLQLTLYTRTSQLEKCLFSTALSFSTYQCTIFLQVP